MARGGFERDERAQGMADELRRPSAAGLDQLGQPVRHLLDGGKRLAARTAMPRQVRRQHAPAVVREPAAVQRPDRMVEAGAMQEDGERQGGIESPAAIRGKGYEIAGAEQHGSDLLRNAQRLRQVGGDIARRFEANG